MMDNLQKLTSLDQIIADKQLDLVKLDFLIGGDPNAYAYFFHNVTASHIDSLRKHGYFKVLSEENENKDGYPNNVSEAIYLERIASEESSKVLAIIQKTKLPSKPNLIVLRCFLVALLNMPKEQLDAAVDVILSGKWIEKYYANSLMGYDYLKLLKNIIEAKKYDLAFRLADKLFDPLPSKQQKDSIDIATYLDDHGYEEMLKLLADTPAKWRMIWMEMLRDKMIAFFAVKYAVRKHKERESKAKFDDFSVVWCETLYEYTGGGVVYSKERLLHYLRKAIDIHLAELKIPTDKRKFVQHLLGDCTQDIFRRLYMYLLDTNADVFKQEIKVELLNPDNFDHFEWKKLLQNRFEFVEDQDQFVKIIFDWAKKIATKRGKSDSEFEQRLIERRTSSLADQLNKSALSLVEKKIGKSLAKKDPVPAFQTTGFRMVGAVSPYDKDALREMSVDDVIAKMLTFRGKEHDMDGPSISGFRDAFMEAVAEQPKKYSASLKSFHNPDLLSDYIYGLFRGLEKVIGGEHEADIHWANVFDLIADILDRHKEGKLEDHPKIERGGIEIYWTGVLSVVLEIVEKAVRQGHATFSVVKNDKAILSIIDYLRHHDDPDEDRPMKESDPAITAINSKRGKAVELLFYFMLNYNKEKGGEGVDKERFVHPEAKRMLDDQIKIEKHPAVRFLFGMYLDWMNYLDPTWRKKQMKAILTGDTTNKLSVLEGYLSGNIRKSLFDDMREHYLWLIDLVAGGLPERKYFMEIDAGLARHIGIAFVSDFIAPDDELLQGFFDKLPAKSRGRLINSLGNGYIHNAKVEKKDFPTEKLKAIWEERLSKTDKSDAEELVEFSWWCNTDYFDEAWMLERLRDTVQKTNGALSYEYTFTDNVEQFAKSHPLFTVEIIEQLLKDKNGIYIRHESNIKDALRDIYKQEKDKLASEKAYKVVDRMVGSGYFEFRSIVNS